jgi:hypothetical protein
MRIFDPGTIPLQKWDIVKNPVNSRIALATVPAIAVEELPRWVAFSVA